MENRVRSKIIKSITSLCLTVVSSTAFTQGLCSENKHALIFSNGMFNVLETAEQNLRTLSKRTEDFRFSQYQLAYNHSETASVQLIQVLDQYLSKEGIDSGWSILTRLALPGKTGEELRKLLYSFKSIDVRDKDLVDQLAKYQTLLKKNVRITVVAHSQGNFYANLSHTLLKEQFGEIPFRLVSVANPDSFVAGNGPHRTLKSDWLIRSIPRSMPANVSNGSDGVLEHEFVRHYLGKVSGPEILKLVADTKKLNDSTLYDLPNEFNKDVPQCRAL